MFVLNSEFKGSGALFSMILWQISASCRSVTSGVVKEANDWFRFCIPLYAGERAVTTSRRRCGLVSCSVCTFIFFLTFCLHTKFFEVLSLDGPYSLLKLSLKVHLSLLSSSSIVCSSQLRFFHKYFDGL